MAHQVHVVFTGVVSINPITGAYIDKNGDTATPATIKEVLVSEHQHRVIPDASIPNSVGRPTIKEYIELEADDDFVVRHIDQYIIITYETTTP